MCRKNVINCAAAAAAAVAEYNFGNFFQQKYAWSNGNKRIVKRKMICCSLTAKIERISELLEIFWTTQIGSSFRLNSMKVVLNNSTLPTSFNGTWAENWTVWETCGIFRQFLFYLYLFITPSVEWKEVWEPWINHSKVCRMGSTLSFCWMLCRMTVLMRENSTICNSIYIRNT